MNTVQAHYDAHLGPVYAWMLGNPEAALKRSSAELEEMGLPSGREGAMCSALDLGAGIGLHSVALAKRGYQVTAIDSCRVLLEEIRSRAKGLPIAAVEADIGSFAAHVTGPSNVILCLGDTLTHLPSFDAVESLIRDVAAALAPGGVFAATFRDYASKTLEGSERFILVKRDATRILSCFLEYAAQHITVHDLLTQREEEGWVQRVSSYPKLRLAPRWLVEKLEAAGLAARVETAPSGMVRVLAHPKRDET